MLTIAAGAASASSARPCLILNGRKILRTVGLASRRTAVLAMRRESLLGARDEPVIGALLVGRIFKGDLVPHRVAAGQHRLAIEDVITLEAGRNDPALPAPLIGHAFARARAHRF